VIAVSLSLTVFLGDKRRLDFPIVAREIPEDLAREITPMRVRTATSAYSFVSGKRPPRPNSQ